GVSPGVAGGQCRHWCGVWREADVGEWLTSGSLRGAPPQLDARYPGGTLVGANTVGSEASNSEHVVAGRMPVRTWPGFASAPVVEGGFAWWVGDESVKIPVGEHRDDGSPRIRPPWTP